MTTTNSNLTTTNNTLNGVASTVNNTTTGVQALNTNLNNITTTVNALAGNTYEAGMIAHFTGTTCPSGWTALASAQGRYIVGLNPGGTQAGTGGVALGDLEKRLVPQHNHGISDPGHQHFIDAAPTDDHNFSTQGQTSQQYGVWADAGGYNVNPPYSGVGVNTILQYTGISVSTFGDYAAASMAAPYIQYLVCQKN